MPTPRTARRFLPPLLAALAMSTTACYSASGGPVANPTSTTTTAVTTSTAASTTTTTESGSMPATVDGAAVDLVRQPCAAIGPADATALGLQGPGSEIDLSGVLSCRWMAGIAIVALKPYPTTDITVDPAMQNRTSPTQINGYQARTGIQGTDVKNCLVLVSTGAGQSFELMLLASGTVQGHDLCDALGIGFASAVLSHLP